MAILFVIANCHLISLVSRPRQVSPVTFRHSSRRSSFQMSLPTTKPTNKALLTKASDLVRLIESGESEDLTIIDVRGHVEKPGGRVESGIQSFNYITDDNLYFAGHIPGASFIDWQKINLYDHTELCDMLAQRGVQVDRPIIVYDWGDMLFATRLWYACVAMGCEHVSVLNGGWNEWDRISGPVSLDTYCPLKMYSEFESPLQKDETPSQTITLEDMRKMVDTALAATKDSSAIPLLLDARSAKQYHGIEQRAKFGGHIPTAKNIPYRKLLNEDGIGLRTDNQLAEVLKDCCEIDQISNITSVVSYCNGGVASTLVLFCLARCGMDLDRAKNYCASFGEWGNLDDVPIEK